MDSGDLSGAEQDDVITDVPTKLLKRVVACLDVRWA